MTGCAEVPFESGVGPELKWQTRWQWTQAVARTGPLPDWEGGSWLLALVPASGHWSDRLSLTHPHNPVSGTLKKNKENNKEKPSSPYAK